jgi:hypothetical protein
MYIVCRIEFPFGYIKYIVLTSLIFCLKFSMLLKRYPVQKLLAVYNLKTWSSSYLLTVDAAIVSASIKIINCHLYVLTKSTFCFVNLNVGHKEASKQISFGKNNA